MWKRFDDEKPPIDQELLIELPGGEHHMGQFALHNERYVFSSSLNDFVVGDGGDEVPDTAILWMSIPEYVTPEEEKAQQAELRGAFDKLHERLERPFDLREEAKFNPEAFDQFCKDLHTATQGAGTVLCVWCRERRPTIVTREDALAIIEHTKVCPKSPLVTALGTLKRLVNAVEGVGNLESDQDPRAEEAAKEMLFASMQAQDFIKDMMTEGRVPVPLTVEDHQATNEALWLENENLRASVETTGKVRQILEALHVGSDDVTLAALEAEYQTPAVDRLVQIFDALERRRLDRDAGIVRVVVEGMGVVPGKAGEIDA